MRFLRFLKLKSKFLHLKHLIKKRRKTKIRVHHLLIVAQSIAKKIKGFTLIELLVVIAVLSILAVIILVAINPQNKLAESKDSIRKAAVSMLGSASQAYSLLDIVTGIAYPEAKSNWIESLVTESEIKTAPPLVPVNDNYYCQEDQSNGWYRQNGYCYKTNNTRSQATITVRLESQAELGKCPVGTKYTYFVWSSELGKAGTYCTQDGGAIGDEPGITIFPGLTPTVTPGGPIDTPTVTPPGGPTLTPTVTPGGTPSCSSYGSCSTCITGAPYTCGWNGVSNSCENKPNQSTCPAGYTQWYWGSCSTNVCAAPTATPTITLTPTPACSNYGSCSTCITGAPYTCGWNGVSNSCENKPNQSTCPAGYTQWYWGSCSTNVCAAPTATPTITPTPTITQTPTPIPYLLTVSVNGTGKGSITSSPSGMNCLLNTTVSGVVTCYANYSANTNVVLSVSTTCTSFTGWAGAGCSGTGNCTIQMNSNKTVVANFTAGTCTLTVSKAGTGTGTVTSTDGYINCGSICSHAYNFGTSNITINAVPSSGYFSGWSNPIGTCAGSNDYQLSCTQSMDNNYLTTANFTVPTQSKTGWSDNSCFWQNMSIMYDCNYSNYTFGQWFSSNRNGQIIQLCGIFDGSNQVRLIDASNYSTLASVNISGIHSSPLQQSDWRCVSISPVNIYRDKAYYVVADTIGTSKVCRTTISNSGTCGIITTTNAVYQTPSGTFNSSHGEASGWRYGFVDVVAQW